MPPFVTGLAAKVLGAVALVAVGFMAGWEVKGAFDAKAQVTSANAAAAQLKHEAAVAQSAGAAGQAQADLDAGAFAQAETKIQMVTRTLVRKVPVYVPAAKPATELPQEKSNATETMPVVTYGVSCGLLRLHDAAATGVSDPSQLPICAGKPDDAPANIDLSQFADVLIQNYGAFESNREQLIELQDWARQVQLWYADLKQKLESGK
jgi:hypothetical protein